MSSLDARDGRGPAHAGAAPEANAVVLRDGRTLEYREFGDPAGHPVVFFHGLIGSYHQASYVADDARRVGLRVIAPNRAGVGRSGFVVRRCAVDTVSDLEDLAGALGLGEFSVIGISGGTPYAMAALHRLGERIRTVTVISGMGPAGLPGALRGMDRRRRVFFELGCRVPHLARRVFRRAADAFRDDPERLLRRLVATWSRPDRRIFERRDVFELFLRDLHAVFTEGKGAEGLAQELILYRRYGFRLGDLPRSRVTLWQGLDDHIVPPSMAWAMTRALPGSEAHFVPGGHFMAVDQAPRIMARLREQLGVNSSRPSI